MCFRRRAPAYTSREGAFVAFLCGTAYQASLMLAMQLAAAGNNALSNAPCDSPRGNADDAGEQTESGQGTCDNTGARGDVAGNGDVRAGTSSAAGVSGSAFDGGYAHGDGANRSKSALAGASHS